MRTAIRLIVAPIMVLLYLGVAVPLLVVYVMDWAFDALGELAGFDTGFFPLPRAQDEDFRFRKWTIERTWNGTELASATLSEPTDKPNG